MSIFISDMLIQRSSILALLSILLALFNFSGNKAAFSPVCMTIIFSEKLGEDFFLFILIFFFFVTCISTNLSKINLFSMMRKDDMIGRNGKLLILPLFWLSAWEPILHAQSGLQRMDQHILENLAAGRTAGQTQVWRFVSDANIYVNVAIPVGVLVDGLIENNARTKQNALYIASSTATTYLLNLAIKKLVKRPRPFITDIHLTAVYRPGEYSFPSGHA